MSTRPTRRETTHERIVDVAARTLRRNGYAGVGVADVMKQAGLTHGGFYAHFESRDALLAEAIERAGRDSGGGDERAHRRRRARGASALRALVEGYLSDEHLSAAETGCVVAALSSRDAAPVCRAASAVGARVNDLIAMVKRRCRRAAAWSRPRSSPATMVGALQLARTLGANAEARRCSPRRARPCWQQYDTE